MSTRDRWIGEKVVLTTCVGRIVARRYPAIGTPGEEWSVGVLWEGAAEPAWYKPSELQALDDVTTLADEDPLRRCTACGKRLPCPCDCVGLDCPGCPTCVQS